MNNTLLTCVVVQPTAGLLPWQRVCVDRLIDDHAVQVVGWLSCTAPASFQPNPQRMIERCLDRATRPRSARGRARHPRMQAALHRGTHSVVDSRGRNGLSAKDYAWLRERIPNFVLIFDAGLTLDTDRTLARSGLWRFSEGGTPDEPESGPAIAALARAHTRLTLTLWAQSGRDTTPAPIAQAHTPAVLHSRRRSLARLYEVAPDLLRRAVTDLRSTATPLSSPMDPMPKLPSANWPQFIRAMLRETLRRWFEKLWLRQRWDIGIIGQRLPIPGPQQIAGARWLPGPKTGFWADPCLVADTTTPTLLVEEYTVARGKGEITRLDRISDPVHTTPATSTLLRIDEHLSFPRSYVHAGMRWLVPEMAAAGKQRAYRMDAAGQRVDAAPITIQGLCGIDPVLFYRDDQYWAFISPRGRRANYQLDLYMADDFSGPYRRHPASPIRIDPNGGRSAGPVIADGQRLLRFGQVFGRRYGEAIDVFEITELTPERYGEHRVARIRPDEMTGAGMHTIDVAPELTVIDRFRLEPVWRPLLARLQRSLRK